MKCGKKFRAFMNLNGRVTTFCSKRCQGAADRKRRVAYLAAWSRAKTAKLAASLPEKLDPLVIFERDAWTCSICSKPVSRSAAYPDQLMATLDHVIPISKGGAHTASNVRCAHLICNIRRGNRIA